MSYSKGICWVDDCRIPYLNGVEGEFSESYLRSGVSKSNGSDLILNISGNKRDGVYVNQQGRFTPSLLVCDDMLNDSKITETNTSIVNNKQVNNIGLGLKPIICKKQGDKGTNSRYYDLDKWFDKVIDEIR